MSTFNPIGARLGRTGLAFSALISIAALATPAVADHGYDRRGSFSFGFSTPGYYDPPGYYYAPPPRYYYAPPPRYYYAPPPRYYNPPPVYYYPEPRYYRRGPSFNFVIPFGNNR
jgi:hypothetical protein